jgi:bifunctional DNA-binding transcriptional regulator/antitoxin component of YhaV-PrlF toxin-antitoxin module
LPLTLIERWARDEYGLNPRDKLLLFARHEYSRLKQSNVIVLPKAAAARRRAADDEGARGMAKAPGAEDSWFDRVRSKGGAAAHAARGDNGQALILDNGWAASLIEGRWREGIQFSHEQIADFSPVTDQAQVEGLASQARAALGQPAADPFHARSNDEWPEAEA